MREKINFVLTVISIFLGTLVGHYIHHNYFAEPSEYIQMEEVYIEITEDENGRKIMKIWSRTCMSLIKLGGE